MIQLLGFWSDVILVACDNNESLHQLYTDFAF